MDKERVTQLQEEPLGVVAVCDDIVCKGCIFSTGSTPFDDTPNKSYCAIYTRDSGKMKPKDIYFNGAPCKYRREK